jgi:regulator of sigma D
MTSEDFQTRKKNTQKSLNDFCKHFQKHLKSGHKHIDEKL